MDVRLCENSHGLEKPVLGNEIGLATGMGNHKGCPYNGFAGACFHSNDGN